MKRNTQHQTVISTFTVKRSTMRLTLSVSQI
ncbi:Uncharacterised protein [Vibrio cholerae]|nr:Uncharacterised protein [Vibrio cholerae]